MPRTRKPKVSDVPEEILDHFAGPARPMTATDVEAVMRRFKKALVERMLGGELTPRTSARTAITTATAAAMK